MITTTINTFKRYLKYNKVVIKLKQKNSEKLNVNFPTLSVNCVIYTIVESLMFFEQPRPHFPPNGRPPTRNSARKETY